MPLNVRGGTGMVEAAAVASAVGGATANRRPVGRRFYVGAAAFVILLNSAGFFPSFVDGARRLGDPTWLVTAHAALAAGWLLLFLTQAILVTSGRMTAHRRLGAASPFIAAAMIATG